MILLAFDGYQGPGGDVVSSVADALNRHNAIHEIGQRVTKVRNAENKRLDDGTKRTRWKWENISSDVAEDLKQELEMMGMNIVIKGN